MAMRMSPVLRFYFQLAPIAAGDPRVSFLDKAIRCKKSCYEVRLSGANGSGRDSTRIAFFSRYGGSPRNAHDCVVACEAQARVLFPPIRGFLLPERDQVTALLVKRARARADRVSAQSRLFSVHPLCDASPSPLTGKSMRCSRLLVVSRRVNTTEI